MILYNTGMYISAKYFTVLEDARESKRQQLACRSQGRKRLKYQLRYEVVYLALPISCTEAP
jgi:hypothetical protein